MDYPTPVRTNPTVHFVSRFYRNDQRSVSRDCIPTPVYAHALCPTWTSEMTVEMANGTDLGHCVLVFELKEKFGKVNTRGKLHHC